MGSPIKEKERKKERSMNGKEEKEGFSLPELMARKTLYIVFSPHLLTILQWDDSNSRISFIPGNSTVVCPHCFLPWRHNQGLK